MITSKITIKAPASAIWLALTDTAQMKEWYFDIPDFELREGAVFNFFEPGGANLFHHRCKILEIVPEKKFSHTWTHPDRTNGISVVTWFLNEKDGATEVVLEHKGTENFYDAGPEFAPENYQMGWDGFMAILKNYMYGLRKSIYQIEVDAPAEKVWNVLFDFENYKKWTSAFCEGSYLTGDLKQGGRVHFLTPEGHGMYSDVIFYTPNQNVLFMHIGDVENHVEKPVDEDSEKWTGAFEGYTLKEKNGKTLVIAEVDVTENDKEHMDSSFPKGLEKVKEMAEETDLQFTI